MVKHVTGDGDAHWQRREDPAELDEAVRAWVAALRYHPRDPNLLGSHAAGELLWTVEVRNVSELRFLSVISLAIEELPAIIKQDIEEFLEMYPQSPAARLRPRMGMVGDIWLAFIGSKLRRGASGLGQTPRDALEDFNRHFLEPVVSSNGSEAD